jgi:hypothetical protein
MTTNAKVLVPDQEWLIKDGTTKIASISKIKKGYLVLRQGKSITFKNLAEIKSAIGIAFFEETIKKSKRELKEPTSYSIYGYPCKNKPYEPLYNVQKKLPLYIKRLKSKSQHCAGYYLIRFGKGWVKSFCPKLITLERYPFQGPFKTEEELKPLLKLSNQNETIKHNSNRRIPR